MIRAGNFRLAILAGAIGLVSAACVPNFNNPWDGVGGAEDGGGTGGAGGSGTGSSGGSSTDTVAPHITGVSSSVPNGAYGVGATIDIRVVFSESVHATGGPSLSLETGS